MIAAIDPNTTPQGIFLTILPGPERKRKPRVYRYDITYRGPEDDAPGCVMTWTVTGGRMPYQIALERPERGGHIWHCTCADAVYRCEADPHHRCKHIRGLIACTPHLADPR